MSYRETVLSRSIGWRCSMHATMPSAVRCTAAVGHVEHIERGSSRADLIQGHRGRDQADARAACFAWTFTADARDHPAAVATRTVPPWGGGR
jgi:hypothetical protein